MYIKVRVQAGSKRESFEQKDTTTYFISVTEPAERNLANRRVVALCARYLKVPVSKVKIISGHRSPSKILAVDSGAAL